MRSLIVAKYKKGGKLKHRGMLAVGFTLYVNRAHLPPRISKHFDSFPMRSGLSVKYFAKRITPVQEMVVKKWGALAGLQSPEGGFAPSLDKLDQALDLINDVRFGRAY